MGTSQPAERALLVAESGGGAWRPILANPAHALDLLQRYQAWLTSQQQGRSVEGLGRGGRRRTTPARLRRAADGRPSSAARLRRQRAVRSQAPRSGIHHRIKTFAGWQTKQPFRGIQIWRDPYGAHCLIDHTGTRRLGHNQHDEAA